MELVNTLIMLTVTAFAMVMYLFAVGGRFLRYKIKSKLPWLKGKGKHVSYTDRSGRKIYDYILCDKNGFVITPGGGKVKLGNTEHILYDATMGKAGTPLTMDGEPLYEIVEGSPTNIAIKRRDFDEDIEIVKVIINKIDVSLTSDTNDAKAKLCEKINKLLLTLSADFKYLRSAKNVVTERIDLPSFYISEGNNKIDRSLNDYLTEYRKGFVTLSKIFLKKNGTMVNYNDLFPLTNLTHLFNDMMAEMYRHGRAEKSVNDGKIGKGLTIGGVVLAIGIVILIIIVVGQGNRIEEMSTSLAQISTKLDKVNITPQGIVNPPIANASTQIPSPTVNTVTGT